jgi:hypothetical protein
MKLKKPKHGNGPVSISMEQEEWDILHNFLGSLSRRRIMEIFSGLSGTCYVEVCDNTNKVTDRLYSLND